MKKKLDNLSLLSLIPLVLGILICIIGIISIVNQLPTLVPTTDGYVPYIEVIQANGHYVEAVQLFIMMPIGILVFAYVFVDCLLRKEVSHIPALLAGGLYVLAYCIVNFIGGIIYSGLGPAVFYALSAIAAGATIYFFIKKMLDGDVTLGWKISGGALIVLTFFSVCVAYPFLEAFSHLGDTIFWTGGFFGLTVLIFAGILLVISATSDYDPNPIELDEFGNPIDNDK